MSSTQQPAGSTGTTSGDSLVSAMGHPQEKTAMGNFIGKITGANKVEKYLDKAWNYAVGEEPVNGAAAASGEGGEGGEAPSSSAATNAQK